MQTGYFVTTIALVCLTAGSACSADDQGRNTPADSETAKSTDDYTSEAADERSKPTELEVESSDLPPTYDEAVHDESIGVRSTTQPMPISIIALGVAKKHGISIEEFYSVNPEWEKVRDNSAPQGETFSFGYFKGPW